MDEYQKAKAKQMADNFQFIEAIKLLGLEATYFCGEYTVKNNGKFIGKMTAEHWLAHFKEAIAQNKQERGECPQF